MDFLQQTKFYFNTKLNKRIKQKKTNLKQKSFKACNLTS